MARKVDIVCNRYYRYDEIVAYLQAVAAAHPDLTMLTSIGKSYEGRDIWALALTNQTTGSHEEKPAVYVDGNIHAGEVTASMVCLYTIDYLVSNFGENEEVTELLNSRTFYVLPRVNPDGAEKYLTTPEMLRSSTKPYPDSLPEFEELPGLHPADIDGDGWILTMRVRDDKKGEWKVSAKDQRLLIARRPGERKGPFYRLFSEGLIEQYEGEPFKLQRSPFGLDLNRNFPQNWDLEVSGGGVYPSSEPEAKAIIDFILAHKNISILNAFHTYGGFFFRNPYQYGDEKMDQDDLRATREIAREGTYVTGYPDVKSNNRATLTEWAYEQHGIIAYTTELWDRLQKAGIDREEFARASTPEKKEEMQLKLLEWNDRDLGGQGFFNWRPFEHPQLGEVEIGGWNPKYVLQNPPQKFLEAECHKNCQWVLRQAGALPQATLGECTAEPVGDGIWKVTAVCENAGYLPTHTTNKGKQAKAVKPDRVCIEGYQALLSGKPELEIGFLEGYLNGQGGGWYIRPAESAARVSWLVQAAAGSKLKLTLTSQRGGVARAELELQ